MVLMKLYNSVMHHAVVQPTGGPSPHRDDIKIWPIIVGLCNATQSHM